MGTPHTFQKIEKNLKEVNLNRFYDPEVPDSHQETRNRRFKLSSPLHVIVLWSKSTILRRNGGPHKLRLVLTTAKSCKLIINNNGEVHLVWYDCSLELLKTNKNEICTRDAGNLA